MIWLKSASNQAVTIAVGVAQFGRFGVVFLHACLFVQERFSRRVFVRVFVQEPLRRTSMCV